MQHNIISAVLALIALPLSGSAKQVELAGDDLWRLLNQQIAFCKGENQNGECREIVIFNEFRENGGTSTTYSVWEIGPKLFAFHLIRSEYVIEKEYLCYHSLPEDIRMAQFYLTESLTTEAEILDGPVPPQHLNALNKYWDKMATDIAEISANDPVCNKHIIPDGTDGSNILIDTYFGRMAINTPQPARIIQNHDLLNFKLIPLWPNFGN